MKSINYINKTTKRKLLWIGGAAMTLAIPYVVLLFNPDHIESEQSLCPFMMATGLPCPGCGITKSLIFLYRLDLMKSLSFHLFGPFVFLFCLLSIGVLSVELVTKKEYFRTVLFNKSVAYALGLALGSYHLVRLFFFLSNNSVDQILSQSIWK